MFEKVFKNILTQIEQNRINDIRIEKNDYIVEYLHEWKKLKKKKFYSFNVIENVYHTQINLIEDKINKNYINYQIDYHKFGDWMDDLWVPPYDIEKGLLDECKKICQKFCCQKRLFSEFGPLEIRLKYEKYEIVEDIHTNCVVHFEKL